MSYSTLASKLKALRGTIDQQQLADVIGVSRQTISMWENGHFSPTTKHLIKICRYYDIELTDLLNDIKSVHFY